MKHLLILGICITLISACDTKRKNDEPVAGSANSLSLALNTTIDESIVPDISTFKTQTETLQANATTFCADINQVNLESIQDQWKTLSLQWNKIAMYNFGPLNSNLLFPEIDFIESMRANGVDYTTIVRGEITSQLGGTGTLNENYFNTLPFTTVGMLALEVLIFEDSISNDNSDITKITADYAGNSRKCDYLKGMIQRQLHLATVIENGWLVNFDNTNKAFIDSLIDGDLADGSESVPALLSIIQQHLDYLNKRKLGASGIFDAQVADYFYENINATLDAIETFLEGSTEDSYSFFDQMTANNFVSEVTLVRANITSAKTDAAAENRSELATAIGLLDGNFKREIPDSLNVILDIVFTDGD